MARPLWRDLRSTRQGDAPHPAAGLHRATIVTAVAAGLGAVAAITVSSTLGDLHGKTNQQAITAVAAACFVVLAVIATRALASGLGMLIAERGAASSASAIRLITTIAGYLVVLFVTLGMLDVPIQHVLLGGAITGVIIGIAAQQALGNVFAGLVLLLARPFTVGQHIRVRSGTYGGEFDGVVRSMSLTYVTIDTPSGLLNVPNAGMLAAAVGPYSASAAGPAGSLAAPAAPEAAVGAGAPGPRRRLSRRARATGNTGGPPHDGDAQPAD
jgi:small-conductance mechanosensitive channel